MNTYIIFPAVYTIMAPSIDIILMFSIYHFYYFFFIFDAYNDENIVQLICSEEY